MYPALSVVLFTSLSGAGYGLLFVTGILLATGRLAGNGTFALVTLLVAAVLISAGLISSTLHLRRPARAWRALSQWRSSWLSREGVAALLTYLPIALLAVLLLRPGASALAIAVTATAAAGGAAVTVWCTAMIYASLRSIRQWHHRYVVPVYLSFALMTGLFWLAALLSVFGLPDLLVSLLAIFSALLAWGVKWLYWHSIDVGPRFSTTGSATGLAGDVRVFDPPHTEQNYLLEEMGYLIARKHRHSLRRIALLPGLLVPLLLTDIHQQWLPGLAWLCAPLAALSVMIGVALERWLFFAEAEHTVMLYYRDLPGSPQNAPAVS